MINIERKILNLDNISNFLKNPRHKEAENQVEVLNLLFKGDNARKMYNLAKNICEEGLVLSQSPLIFFDKSNNEYKAYDGNRRIASMKAVLNPNLIKNYVSENIYKSFCELSKEYSESLNKNIDVVITEDEAYAISQIEKIHSGENNGVGQTKWGSEEKDRFQRNFRNKKPTITLNIKNNLDKMNLSFENQFQYTDIARIFRNPAIKKLVGENKDDYKILNNDQIHLVKKIIDKMTNEAQKKSAPISRCFDKSSDIDAFLNANESEFKKINNKSTNDFLTENYNEPKEIDNSQDNSDENVGNTRMPRNLKKSTLIEKNWSNKYIGQLIDDFLDIESLLRLLTNTSFELDKKASNHTPIAVLFRCLIEYATYGYQKVYLKKEIDEIAKAQKGNLLGFINDTKNHMLSERKNIKDFFKTFPQGKDIQQLQGSIHIPGLQISKDMLVSMFKNMQLYLEICLDKLLKIKITS